MHTARSLLHACAQADALSAAGYHPDQFVFLDVPDSLVVGRRTDPETGASPQFKLQVEVEVGAARASMG
jgi:hypothetical protein